jgi:hypothetical protein
MHTVNISLKGLKNRRKQAVLADEYPNQRHRALLDSFFIE